MAGTSVRKNAKSPLTISSANHPGLSNPLIREVSVRHRHKCRARHVTSSPIPISPVVTPPPSTARSPDARQNTNRKTPYVPELRRDSDVRAVALEGMGDRKGADDEAKAMGLKAQR